MLREANEQAERMREHEHELSTLRHELAERAAINEAEARASSEEAESEAVASAVAGLSDAHMLNIRPGMGPDDERAFADASRASESKSSDNE